MLCSCDCLQYLLHELTNKYSLLTEDQCNEIHSKWSAFHSTLSTQKSNFFLRCGSSACWIHTITHTHTHPFNGPFSGTTQVNRYQKGKTNLDLNEARGGWFLGRQWHQLDHIQRVCTSLQTDNHTNISSLNFLQPGYSS